MGITLLMKNGFKVTKTRNESNESEVKMTDTNENENKEAENKVEEKPSEEPQVSSISLAEFEEMKKKMQEMEKKLSEQTALMAKLAQDSLEGLKQEILAINPKAELDILLAGIEDTAIQRKILSAHLAGLKTAKETPTVELSGVDNENKSELKPEEIEQKLMKEMLGFETDPFGGNDK